uniref:hypothetical protein n=1 Tax=Alloprevotella sp. TaxID=1872471 RepID=UPI003FEFE26C
METKKEKDELMEAVLKNLKKWENANEAKHRHLLIAANGSGIQTMCNCSLLDLIVMFGILTLDSPQFALAIKKVAGHIDRLMQSEPTYQKLKDDKDLSEITKNEMFMNYFKQAVEKKDADLAEFLTKSSDTASDDDNEEEQS